MCHANRSNLVSCDKTLTDMQKHWKAYIEGTWPVKVHGTLSV